uniref:uncharacterized protein LOC109965213 n=1 Tax=Monopterus albus TaxID=43700 RepID=UPI0009B4961F|nr:uncharacterized protein LOC109965213 [Monopterus albus]
MAASSKSSQTAKNVVLALLALWSVISLIIIVVWATSPDLKSSAQCRKELQDKTEKLEGAKVVWNKDKVALEELVLKARQERDHHRAECLLLEKRFNATNILLEECQQERGVLHMNISVLREDIEQLRQMEANLTAQLRLQEDHIEELQQNLTQAFHKTESCFSLKDAAQSQMQAAKSQTRACESNQQYLQKQLHKCKTEPETPKVPKQTAAPSCSTDDNNSASPLAGIPVLALLVCSALHLIT